MPLLYNILMTYWTSFVRGIAWQRRLAYASICPHCVKLKSSFECLNKDYGQTHKLQRPSFLDELCLVKTDITCVAGLVAAAEEVKCPVKLAHSLNMKTSQLKERIRMRRLNKIKDGGSYLTPHGVTEDSLDFLWLLFFLVEMKCPAFECLFWSFVLYRTLKRTANDFFRE